ncbi:hypothetical protein Tco_1483603 [Tanacetum coccineum]
MMLKLPFDVYSPSFRAPKDRAMVTCYKNKLERRVQGDVGRERLRGGCGKEGEGVVNKRREEGDYWGNFERRSWSACELGEIERWRATDEVANRGLSFETGCVGREKWAGGGRRGGNDGLLASETARDVSFEILRRSFSDSLFHGEPLSDRDWGEE